MKKIALVLMGSFLGLSSMANAAGYAVIDLEKVVESSTYLKQQNASLQQSIQPQTKRLGQIGKELQDLQQEASQGNIKEADAKQMSTQYQAKLTEFNTTQQAVQSKVQTTLQTMNKTLEGRVKQAAEQLRQENSLDFVLNKNAALAYDAKNDLTDKMIQKVNAVK